MSFLNSKNPITVTRNPSQNRYRFIANGRSSKWYDDLVEAQRHSEKIGAGFYDERTGKFFAYPGTTLEVALEEGSTATA